MTDQAEKIAKIKDIVQKIDINKVNTYLEKKPNSGSLRRVIKNYQEVLEKTEEEEVKISARKLNHYLNVMANLSPYVQDETEKKRLNELIEELKELSVE